MSFGRDYGPTAPVKSSNPFIRPSPPYSVTAVATAGSTVRAPRAPGGIDRVQSPPGFESSGAGWRPYQPSGFPRGPGAQRAIQPPLYVAYPAPNLPYEPTGIRRPSGSPYRWANGQRPPLQQNAPETYIRPSITASVNASQKSENSLTATIGRSQELRRTRSPPFSTTGEDFSRDFSQTAYQSSPIRDGYASPSASDPNLSISQDKPVVSTYTNYEQRNRSSSKQAGVQPLKRTRSPPIQSFAEVPQGHKQFGQNNSKKRSISPPIQGAGLNSHSIYSQSPKTFFGSANDVISPAAKSISFSISREPRSPLSYDDEILQGNTSLVPEASDRPSTSPAKQGSRLNIYSNASQSPDRIIDSTNEPVASVAKTTSFTVSKRTRSPSRYDDEILQGNSRADQMASDREMEAKAKRLARFRAELVGTAESNPSYVADQKIFGNVQQHSMDKRNPGLQRSTESAGVVIDDNALSDSRVSNTSSIIGLCPEMCPESERGERERKGDLDQFERLDGDRNQTTKFLAVKKYTRTAEREAYLIRPMPVLQKTMDYLLSLLDQPYDDSFLGMYNFLWDRMRAIRMDSRMQHIFNKEAITMLEQMIRLHIIAMHELCEYTKGEGFSEGFDAHLNIEQMNKTSVELFQMYDDHQKKGINVPTEKEFRGYYALLKLDKHPGYRVEPAELSLDLAKMTAEVRKTPEVLFARDVARVCRAGNYVAFFRLARKASYLQACLMHAHFVKLRTQALAALHSCLQSNQGLPISRIASWLVLEEEDIESLLEYHGFVIKEYEEPYMVKEGPFLNAEDAYPTKCSKLVHLKRSRKIVQDVTTTPQMTSLPMETRKEHQLSRISKQNSKAIPPVEAVHASLTEDEEMADSHVVSSLKDGAPPLSEIENPVVDNQIMNNKTVASFSTHDSFSTWSSPGSVADKVGVLEKVHDEVQFITPERRMFFGIEDIGSENLLRKSPVGRSASGKYNYATHNLSPRRAAPDRSNSLPERSPSTKDGHSVGSSLSQSLIAENLMAPLQKSSSAKYPYVEDKSVSQASVSELGDEPSDVDEEIGTDTDVSNYHDEVADSKLKLTLRLWRRRTSKLKQLREARQTAADAARNSLSFGPPVQITTTEWTEPSKLDFDHVMWERRRNHEKSWSRLNVSDVVADIMEERNPYARCVCWKIMLCSQLNELEREKTVPKSHVADLEAGTWLLSKLMPINEPDDDLVLSTPRLSIWKKWVNDQSVQNSTCCLSVVRDTQSGNLNEIVCGACSIIFLVCESIPWEYQKAQFHNLLVSIPPGSCLPLLILSSLHTEFSDASSIITNELGLHGIDKSRISSFMIVPLIENQPVDQSTEFFSDKQLRSGLQWLAGESPVQPRLSSIKVRELVISYLAPLLDRLEKRSVEVSPEDCITAFNEALDVSWQDIAVAASANPINWPCPEIVLIPESTDLHWAIKWYLPSLGWSSALSTAPLEHALRDSKLPSILDDISWLFRGSHIVEEIEDKRLQLEHCLVKYMAQSSNVMGAALATKEVEVMLQSNTKLELRDLSYYIIPNWVAIFRRIYNWRLMALSTALPPAYVLEGHHDRPEQEVSDGFLVEGSDPAYSLSRPSLDEIIEAGCSPLKSWRDETGRPVHRTSPSHSVPYIAAHEMDEEKEQLHANIETAEDDDDAFRTSKANDEMPAACREADELSKLLDRCSILQDKIDKKLSIYF